MASFYFRYGAMNSGKSIDILKVAYNYEERGQSVLMLTSGLDVRSGNNKIKSRIGIERNAFGVLESDNILNLFDFKFYDCVLVDEAQFLTKEQIHQLSDIVDKFDIPVICYGLRSDFLNEPFEGSTYLMTICDKLEEMKTVCWCGKKASVNARVINNKFIKDGEQVHVGGNEMYVTLCRKHYKEENLGK